MTKSELSKVTHLEYMKKEKELLKDFGKVDGMCDGVDCSNCPISQENIGFSCEDISEEAILKRIDVVMSYQKTENINIDWGKVEVDTPIYVRNKTNEDWKPSYFAKYEDNKIYVFDLGTTSITNRCDLVCYNYAKLADINNVPKINNNIPKNTSWDILEKNTLIWVRRTKNDDVWLPRYFAKYSNGKVYTFINGKTSFTTKQIVCLNCVKLTNVSIIGYDNTKEDFVSCV